MQSGEYLIEGRRIISEAIANNAPITALFVDAALEDKFGDIINDVPSGVTIYMVTDRIIQTLSDTQAPEGIIACAKIVPVDEQRSLGNVVLLLDGLQDPGNIGTILRTAEAAGIRDVFMSNQCVELYNPKLVRSAMGSLFYLNISRHNLIQKAQQLQAEGYTLIATALNGENFFGRAPVKNKVAVIIGNEGNGISGELLAISDKVYTLPIRGKAESLNAAVAAGIILYNLVFEHNTEV